MLIKAKIEERLEGGPASLRRAFQFFDKDRSGSISFAEFKVALAKYVALASRVEEWSVSGVCAFRDSGTTPRGVSIAVLPTFTAQALVPAAALAGL